jgi:ankyrin repeat protein
LDHGANINQKGTFGGLTHGQGITALHMAAQNGHLGMVKLLLERGADRSIREDLYQSTAESAARYFGQVAVHDFLSSPGA